MSIKSFLGNLVPAFSAPAAEKRPAIQGSAAIGRIADRYVEEQRAKFKSGNIDVILADAAQSTARRNAWAERMANDF